MIFYSILTFLETDQTFRHFWSALPPLHPFLLTYRQLLCQAEFSSSQNLRSVGVNHLQLK